MTDATTTTEAIDWAESRRRIEDVITDLEDLIRDARAWNESFPGALIELEHEAVLLKTARRCRQAATAADPIGWRTWSNLLGLYSRAG